MRLHTVSEINLHTNILIGFGINQRINSYLAIDHASEIFGCIIQLSIICLVGLEL